MFDDASCLYLLPGEVYFADSPVMINTVLGSCVSVTMFSRRPTLGLICHAMLPKASEAFKTDENIFKYVDSSLLYMHEIITEHKIPLANVEVKVFGGSDMFTTSAGSASVGQKNIAAAVSMLDKLHYKVAAKDIGGQFTRKLYFSTETGIVYVRKISKLRGI